MKFCTITLIVLQAVAVASQEQLDSSFWSNFVDNVDSLSSGSPTPPPARNPIRDPTTGPTPPPTTGPTPPPTPGPTPPPPTGPTPPPTPTPTGLCMIDLSLNCTAIMNNEEISCSSIPPEDQYVCECKDCVREVKFKYTGRACTPASSVSGKCKDEGPNAFIAKYNITDCVDPPTQVIAAEEAQQGEYVTIGAPDGACLPACMKVVITLAFASEVTTQNFEIDSGCGGDDGGLILNSDYGAFESVGYSCSETDVHNCIQGVSYGLKVCNIGSTDEQIYKWRFTLNEEEIDLILPYSGDGRAKLNSGECFYDTYEADVDRCNYNEVDFCADIVANATNPETGEPPNCSHKEELCLGPTPQPSPWPSPAPSPAPTSGSGLGVTSQEQLDVSFWRAYVDNVDSLASLSPTPPPTRNPIAPTTPPYGD